jgi:transcriptional regulator with XRE-family HTH domain
MTGKIPLSPNASPVAREIYRRMTELGLTKKRLAELAGLGETYVHDLYRARSSNPLTEQLSKLAAALGCTVDDLRHPGTASDQPRVSKGIEPDSIFPLYPDDVAIVRLWRILPKSAKDLVMLRITELLPNMRTDDGDDPE